MQFTVRNTCQRKQPEEGYRGKLPFLTRRGRGGTARSDYWGNITHMVFAFYFYWGGGIALISSSASNSHISLGYWFPQSSLPSAEALARLQQSQGGPGGEGSQSVASGPACSHTQTSKDSVQCLPPATAAQLGLQSLKKYDVLQTMCPKRKFHILPDLQ